MAIDKKKLFVSSVQAEFQEERRALVAYIRQDAMLSRYFDPYIFEESPAQDRSAQRAYLDEVASSDIYMGLYGERYGYEDAEGVSPTEREYDAATQNNLYRIVLIKDVPERHGQGGARCGAQYVLHIRGVARARLFGTGTLYGLQGNFGGWTV